MYIYIKMFIQHDVLTLKVTVSNTLIMDVVDPAEHLFRIVAYKWLSEWPCFRDPIEQFTFGNNLFNKVRHLLLRTIVQP